MKELLKKYKHGWILSYFFLYIVWFFALEKAVTSKYTPIHLRIDDYIPFNEWFVIPYCLWFAYIFISVAYFFLTSKDDFYKCTAFLFIGMTICLLIYTVWPNGQNLRPDLTRLGRDNPLIRIVAHFYATDTPTNVCPSIHVFNSIGVHIAIHRSEALKKHKWLQVSSFVLMLLICLSTMFLKQHSAFDVIAAAGLSLIMYIAVYGLSGTKLTDKVKGKKVYAEQQS